ncbi:MAG: NAD(+) diphosphatase [Spirochaetales bacterium]|nr:NAD(+) diphosphatase [Spirochaetales bacterium]
MSFISGYKEDREKRGCDFAFLFGNGELLVSANGVPSVAEAEVLLASFGGGACQTESGRSLQGGVYLGMIGRRSCYAYRLPEGGKGGCDNLSKAGCASPAGIKPADGQQFVTLRRYLTELDEDICAAACLAAHIVHWNDKTHFCGRCGTEFSWHGRERAKHCRTCGNVEFPRISPAIIIRIIKDGKLLLAHNRSFPEGRYSLLAGFIEMGETIEEAAAREVKEEAGIEIENIRYLASQCWPFPDSLMIGLTADYKSGELVPDGEEIVHADWYAPDSFPSIPGQGTIARKIIDRYTTEYYS